MRTTNIRRRGYRSFDRSSDSSETPRAMCNYQVFPNPSAFLEHFSQQLSDSINFPSHIRLAVSQVLKPFQVYRPHTSGTAHLPCPSPSFNHGPYSANSTGRTCHSVDWDQLGFVSQCFLWEDVSPSISNLAFNFRS